MASESTRYTVWHQLQSDGLVGSVFASPDDLLYLHMMRHAHYLASLANDGVKTAVTEPEDGVVQVHYTLAESGVEQRETDTLVVGAPDQPFDTVVLMERDRYATASVKDHFETWSAVPDQFILDFEETTT